MPAAPSSTTRRQSFFPSAGRRASALRWIAAVSLLAQPALLLAETTVVVTGEDQIGEAPAAGSRVAGINVAFADVDVPGQVILGEALVHTEAPHEFDFYRDVIHGMPAPQSVHSTEAAFSSTVAGSPSAAHSRNAEDDGDYVAFAFAYDGTLSGTMLVELARFDGSGTFLFEVPVAIVDTFPDLTFNRTTTVVDDQGRVTVALTDLDLTMGFVGTVKVHRFDAAGMPIGTAFDAGGPGRAGADIAKLDAAGGRLIIPSTTFTSIVGRTVDVSSGSPVVSSEFPISTTSSVGAGLPAVAAHLATGAAFVVWELITGTMGDPSDIRGRRFDAMGNPIGDDFVINTMLPGSQGQPDVAVGNDGSSAVVWVAEGAAMEDVDVYVRVYDPQGNPIGDQWRVNSETAGIQDQPTVDFLSPDEQGNERFVVTWRDVGASDGSSPQGTGVGYKCFKILEEVIFADGFESGELSQWSLTVD